MVFSTPPEEYRYSAAICWHFLSTGVSTVETTKMRYMRVPHYSWRQPEYVLIVIHQNNKLIISSNDYSTCSVNTLKVGADIRIKMHANMTRPISPFTFHLSTVVTSMRIRLAKWELTHKLKCSSSMTISLSLSRPPTAIQSSTPRSIIRACINSTCV